MAKTSSHKHNPALKQSRNTGWWGDAGHILSMACTSLLRVDRVPARFVPLLLGPDLAPRVCANRRRHIYFLLGLLIALLLKRLG
jgi:hypothetical protein